MEEPEISRGGSTGVRCRGANNTDNMFTKVKCLDCLREIVLFTQDSEVVLTIQCPYCRSYKLNYTYASLEHGATAADMVYLLPGNDMP